MMPSSNEAPLSSLIALHIKEPDHQSFERIVEMFLHSEVGVMATGAPEGTSGNFVSTTENPITIGLSRDPEGNPAVLVFADPSTFVKNFGAKFNASTLGETVLQAVLLNPECHGVIINSATDEISFIIDRETTAAILGVTDTPGPDPGQLWWKFW